VSVYTTPPGLRSQGRTGRVHRHAPVRPACPLSRSCASGDRGPSGVLVSMRLSSGDGVLWVSPDAFALWPEQEFRHGIARGAPLWSADSCWAAGRIRGRALDWIDRSRCRPSSALAGDDARLHAGHAPRNKGVRYPADPPTVEEIVAVMRIAGDRGHGRRLRGAGRSRRSSSSVRPRTKAALDR
jgi:hypothetical protein